MVGQLKLSPQHYLTSRWEDEKWRKPFLFSVSVHLGILIIALLPSSLFHFSRNIPEVYKVDLVDINEIPTPPPAKEAADPAPEPLAPTRQEKSMQPVLSTRTIPTAPTEIKLIRPRAMKRKIGLPPMDPSLVLTALQRIQQQEKAEKEKQKALEAIRQSILARENEHQTQESTSTAGTASETIGPSTPAVPGYGGPPGSGQAAGTALKKYKAMVARHIGSHWSLPEGQVWDKDLRATVIVEVRQDGIVVDTSFEKRSTSGQFDKFVLQTIKQASPLPAFPQEIPLAPLRLNFYPEGMM